MKLFARHPSSDALADFAHSAPADDDRSRAHVVAHLTNCAECRERLQWIRTTARALASDVPVELPASLRDRVLESRASGARSILPVGGRASRPRTPAMRWAASAAAIVLVALGFVWSGTPEAEAGATAGELRFEPEMPRRGDRVRVTYRPVATLGAEERLVLRARLRTPLDQSYNGGLSTVSLASLARDRKGGFAGEFTLPSGVVFGAFVVENVAASRIDDNDGRPWELLTGAERGQPDFDALDQRAKDLMGRNWEEGHATVRRMVALYPENVSSWNWLAAFDSWLGMLETDSVKAMHRARMMSFDARWRDAKNLDPDVIGELFWYSRNLPPEDSTVSARWRERLQRDAPTNSFAIQVRWGTVLDDLWANKDSVAALRGLDALWREAPPDRLLQVAGTAFSIARKTSDTTAIRLWSDRIIDGSIEPIAEERWMAQQFATMSTHRSEGTARLRRAIAKLDSLPETLRPLGDTREARQQTVDRFRRRLMASLGRALVEDGKAREGLDVLVAAAEDGWDLSVLRSARAASLTAGDTASAMVFASRIAMDPRTDSAASAPDHALAARAIGASAWHAALEDAERTFAERMLANAQMQFVRGRARMKDLSGATTDLATLAAGQVTVVAIWSRSCGPAVEGLPQIGKVAARLAAEGVRVIGVVEERTLTPALSAFLAEKKVTMPTYLDAFGEVTKGFNSWGTPAYYVLDARGRIRFAATSDAEELLARAEAVRLEGALR